MFRLRVKPERDSRRNPLPAGFTLPGPTGLPGTRAPSPQVFVPQGFHDWLPQEARFGRNTGWSKQLARPRCTDNFGVLDRYLTV